MPKLLLSDSISPHASLPSLRWPHLLGLAVIATLATLLTLRTPFVASREGALAVGAGGICALFFLVHRQSWRTYGLVALGAMVLTLHSAERWQSQVLPESCERQEISFRGEVIDLPSPRLSFGKPAYSFLLRVHSIKPIACAGPRRVRLFMAEQLVDEHSDVAAPLQPGDLLSGSARLKLPWGFVNPLSESGERRYLVDDVHALGSVSSLDALKRSEALRSMQRVHRVRASIAVDLLSRADPQVAPLMGALAIGDRRFMSPAHWDVLRTFGLSHLLVVSGLHVSFLAIPGWWAGSGIACCLSFLGLRRTFTRLFPYLGSLSLAALYSTLAGLSLPTVRALAMLALVLLPGICGRPLDRARCFAACVLSLLLLNPTSVLGASFWLSLMAVALLLWLSLWQRGSSASMLVKTQFYLVPAMMPVSLYWFGVASTLGLIANLIAVPLVTWCLLPLLLGGVFLTRFDLTYGWYLIDIVDYIFSKCWLFLTQVQAGATALGEFTSQPAWFYLGIAFGAGLLIALPKSPHRSVLVVLLLAPSILTLPKHDRDVVVRVLDVGQGTAVLISHQFRHVLYDTGRAAPNGRPRIANALMPLALAKGIGTLDLLVISHPDDDHNGGEPFVMEMLSPRRVVRGGVAQRGDGYCRPGQIIPLGPDSWFQSLSTALPGDTDNVGSCVLLLHAFGRQVLLPGDIERKRERDLTAYWGKQLQADVLLAAHHGSNTSTSHLFLRSVDPELVVITSGRANRFGHPTATVLATIADHGARVLNTATDGAITLHITPDGNISCTRQRHRLSPFWMHGNEPRNCSVIGDPSRV